MCWINWIISKSNISKQDLEKMNQAIKHRWPDDSWFFIDKNIWLGQVRLSIIDLSNAWHQPMFYDKNLWASSEKFNKQNMEDSKITITFNGEIYNYQELKQELKQKWYNFSTHTDTEVILASYLEYGTDCVKKFNWMWAFAIYDKRKNIVFASRDRLWIKPFFYYISDNKIIFSSEIKWILKNNIEKKLNKWILNSYFQYRYIIWNETFFEWILKLQAWNNLIIKLENLKIDIKKYWDLDIIDNKEQKDEEYYIKKSKELLIKSIKYRMIADVKVWSYLSWWLDSSLVSTIIQKYSKQKINTYTIWFKEDWFNEFKWSKLVSEKIWSNHHEILLSWENYLDTMEYLIKYKDSPLAVPNEVPLYLMSKELKKDITVVLSWEWADELFWWYGRIFKYYIEKNISIDNFLEKYNYVSNNNLEKFLSNDVISTIQNKKYTYNIFNKIFNKIEKLKEQDKIPYIFQNLHLQWLLERVDMTTMATSVEARVPFVDYKLVEFVNEIPFEYKIKWLKWYNDEIAKKEKLTWKTISENLDITKYLLREISKKYLPEEIINRKKIWFPVPLDNWFKWNFKNYAKNILLDKKTLSRWIFNEEYLISEKWLEELDWINIWMMINLELFLRIYFD